MDGTIVLFVVANYVSEELYKNGIRRYAQMYNNDVKKLEELRDRYLDTVRLINEVIEEYV